MKPEDRKPKAERIPKSKTQTGFAATVPALIIRASAFGFPSGFGFRISDLGRAND
jgi:hypothetical protein